MPRLADLLDCCVLSLVGTVWLLAPAYLEERGAPFILVCEASLVEMPAVVATAALWCFYARARLRGGALSSAPVTGTLLFFGFMAYFWSLVDDGPVDFDSVLTWPEVTGGAQHLFLEVLLHALTLAFLLLAVRKALAGARPRGREGALLPLLVLASFWASYFQNTPAGWVQELATSNWYALDAVEHVVSLACFCLAVRMCLKTRAVHQGLG